MLRREKTFDLDPGTNSQSKEMRVIEIGLEDVAISNTVQPKSSNTTLSRAQIRTLKAFQEQKANFALQLESEVYKLEDIERGLSQKSLNAGRNKVKCWESPARHPKIKQPLDMDPIKPTNKGLKKMAPRRTENSKVPDRTRVESFTLSNGSEDNSGGDAETRVIDLRSHPPRTETAASDATAVVPPKPRPRTMIPTPRRPARKCDSFDTEAPHGSPPVAVERQDAPPVPLQAGPNEFTQKTEPLCSVVGRALLR